MHLLTQHAVRRLAMLLLGTVFSCQVFAQDTQPAELPLTELRTFVEVMERIKTAYVEPIDDKTLLKNAIKGMLSNLDPHSSYLEPSAFQELQETTSGEFGGLGIEVGQEDDVLKVISPIDDTPAFAAGLQAHDLILRIDGQPTKGMSLTQAVEKMRGKPGTPIVLSISRDHRPPFDVTLTRAIIKVRSVRSQLLEDGYGLIRISQFQVNTGDELGKALRTLEKNNKAPLNGLVLDVRNNPGGILQAAVHVVDHFLSKGLIVYTEGRLASTQSRFYATPRNTVTELPLVVLINGGSASASEIVAGALQDHKRAVIMGSKSFGKGSVQTILPLNEDHALKLTTALYFTPLGRSIQAEGIEPDIAVEHAKISPEQRTSGLKEADLAGHLNNTKTPNAANKKPNTGSASDDYQVNQALNLLKGLNIIGRNTSAEP